MRSIDRFGVRTVSLALCVALAASGGQPLWAAVAKQAQVRAPSLAPIPVLPAAIAPKAIGAPSLGAPSNVPSGVVSAEAAPQEAKTQAAVALTGVVQDFHGRPNHTHEALNGIYEGSKAGGSAVGAVTHAAGSASTTRSRALAAPAVSQGAGPLAKAKRILKASAPLIAVAPLAVGLAASDHSGSLLYWLSLAALPILGMISDDEKWNRVQGVLDDQALDETVKQAIRDRTQALKLLDASRARASTQGVMVEKEDIAAILGAEQAAGQGGQENLDRLRELASRWEDWLQIARLERSLGLDVRPSVEKAKDRAGTMRFPGFHAEAVGLLEAFSAIGEAEREFDLDPTASFAFARHAITELLDANPVIHAASVVELLRSLGRSEIRVRADLKDTLAAMRAAIDEYEGHHGVDSTRLWRARALARMAELEIEAGLDPGKTLRAAELWLDQVEATPLGQAGGDVARAQAKAALALLKKSGSILWNAFRIGMPALAVGLLVFVAPSSALAASLGGGASSWGSWALLAAAVPLLGALTGKELWDKIKSLADDEGTDASVRKAIQERERALALLKSSRNRQDRSGSSVEKLRANLAAAKAAVAAGEDAQSLIDQAKSQAYWWDDWVEIAFAERYLGMDPKASLAAARERAWNSAVTIGYEHEIPVLDYALAAHELGQDVREDFARARMQVTEHYISNPDLYAAAAAVFFKRLIQAEMATKADPKESIEALRALLGREDVASEPSERVLHLTDLAELEVAAGLDPAASLRAAETVIQAGGANAYRDVMEGMLARAEANAAMALLKRSASILWNAFRFGAPVLVVGLLAFLAPSSALAATATAKAWAWPTIAMALGFGLFGGVLSLKKWAEIDGLANDEGTDKSLREAIKQHAEARSLLKKIRTAFPGNEYADELLPYMAMLEFEGGIDPSETLKEAEHAALTSRSARSRISTALVMGLAGQDPLPLLQDAKRVIRESKVPAAAYWGAYHAITIAQVEALLGLDYTESLDEAMRSIQREQSSGWQGGFGELSASPHAKRIVDVARAAIQTDLDPAPAFQAARQIDAERNLAMEWLDGSFQTIPQYIDAVAAGQTQPFYFFDQIVLYPEDIADLAQARTLLRQARPKLWPLHRVGPAPL